MVVKQFKLHLINKINYSDSAAFQEDFIFAFLNFDFTLYYIFFFSWFQQFISVLFNTDYLLSLFIFRVSIRNMRNYSFKLDL